MWVKQLWIFRKHLTFYFHYNYIREKYGDKAELFFTDTDSLMYEIQTKDLYQEISKDIQKSLIQMIIQRIIHLRLKQE